MWSWFSIPNLSVLGTIPWWKDIFSHTVSFQRPLTRSYTDLCGPVAPAQKNNTGLKYVSGKYGATNSGVFCLLACVSLAPVMLNYPCLLKSWLLDTGWPYPTTGAGFLRCHSSALFPRCKRRCPPSPGCHITLYLSAHWTVLTLASDLP